VKIQGNIILNNLLVEKKSIEFLHAEKQIDIVCIAAKYGPQI
jgi:hypothetical protein